MSNSIKLTITSCNLNPKQLKIKKTFTPATFFPAKKYLTEKWYCVIVFITDYRF